MKREPAKPAIVADDGAEPEYCPCCVPRIARAVHDAIEGENAGAAIDAMGLVIGRGVALHMDKPDLEAAFAQLRRAMRVGFLEAQREAEIAAAAPAGLH